jgi:hypothetical protein
MRKKQIKTFHIYYNGHYILKTSADTFIVSADNTTHTSLLSAKCWIDYLTK